MIGGLAAREEEEEELLLHLNPAGQEQPAATLPATLGTPPRPVQEMEEANQHRRVDVEGSGG